MRILFFFLIFSLAYTIAKADDFGRSLAISTYQPSEGVCSSSYNQQSADTDHNKLIKEVIEIGGDLVDNGSFFPSIQNIKVFNKDGNECQVVFPDCIYEGKIRRDSLPLSTGMRFRIGLTGEGCSNADYMNVHSDYGDATIKLKRVKTDAEIKSENAEALSLVQNYLLAEKCAKFDTVQNSCADAGSYDTCMKIRWGKNYKKFQSSCHN